MFWIIIADAAIEIIPRKIWRHPSIVADCARRNKPPSRIILNTNYHHSAMVKLESRFRRGRPDITHLCLLNAMNTPLNKVFKKLRVFIHIPWNPDEIMIHVHPDTRVPRSLNRFEGIMVKLLEAHVSGIENHEQLFRIEKMSFKEFI
ncbi:MAG: 16S rRNA methyltransferase, partial [Promethearchaeota archaeon]